MSEQVVAVVKPEVVKPEVAQTAPAPKPVKKSAVGAKKRKKGAPKPIAAKLRKGRFLHSKNGKIVLPWGATLNNAQNGTLPNERAQQLHTDYTARENRRIKHGKANKESPEKAYAKRIIFPAWLKGQRSIDKLLELVGGDGKLVTRSCVVWWNYHWIRGCDLPDTTVCSDQQASRLQQAGYEYMKEYSYLPVYGRQWDNPLAVKLHHFGQCFGTEDNKRSKEDALAKLEELGYRKPPKSK